MKSMNPFEQFNRQFFCSTTNNIIWYDKEGIFSLDEERVVFIVLEDSRTKDHYDGYRVKIVNAKSGRVITNKFFSFKFHIPKWNIIDPLNGYHHAWYDKDKLEWYINKPIETSSMVRIIFDYINKFK